jgi:hypothetical protein
MRYDIQPIEQLSPPCKWQKKWGCNTHCPKVWSNFRTKWIWVCKRWRLADLCSILHRIAIAVRDTDKSLNDTAKYLVYQKKKD